MEARRKAAWARLIELREEYGEWDGSKWQIGEFQSQAFSLLNPVERKKYPLHSAVYNFKTNDIKKYLKANPDIINDTFMEVTPLYFAVEKRNISALKLLLQKGADPNLSMKQASPLMHATLDGNLPAVKILLERGATADQANKDGSTALMMACQGESLEIVKALIDHGADVNAMDNTAVHRTPLLAATSSNRLENAKLLLEKGAKVEIPPPSTASERYTSPLMVAATLDNVDVARLLIEKGADVKRQDKQYLTALHMAASNNCLLTAKLLVKHGADVDFRLEPPMLSTSLSIAAQYNHVKFAEFLIDEGATVDKPLMEGNSALFTCCMMGSSKVASLLLDRGADVNFRNEFNSTPLITAAQSNQIGIVKLLLSRGADVNAKQDDGGTALDFSVRDKYEEISQTLIAAGADFDDLMANKDKLREVKECIEKWRRGEYKSGKEVSEDMDRRMAQLQTASSDTEGGDAEAAEGPNDEEIAGAEQNLAERDYVLELEKTKRAKSAVWKIESGKMVSAIQGIEARLARKSSEMDDKTRQTLHNKMMDLRRQLSVGNQKFKEENEMLSHRQMILLQKNAEFRNQADTAANLKMRIAEQERKMRKNNVFITSPPALKDFMPEIKANAAALAAEEKRKAVDVKNKVAKEAVAEIKETGKTKTSTNSTEKSKNKSVPDGNEEGVAKHVDSANCMNGSDIVVAEDLNSTDSDNDDDSASASDNESCASTTDKDDDDDDSTAAASSSDDATVANETTDFAATGLEQHSESQVCWNCKKKRKDGKNLNKCGSCKVVRYCGKKCQLEHWIDHQDDCQQMRKERKREKARKWAEWLRLNPESDVD